MTKTKGFIVVALLLAFVSVFGAWTSNSDANAETRYVEPMLLSTYASEVINYTSIEEVGPITTAGGCPAYKNISGLTNSCGAIAGAEIVAFYDKYFPDLIPNWVSYYTASGKYRTQDTTIVPALIREMYTLMRTNVDGVGVSRTDFIVGLTNYVSGNGHLVNFQNVMSGGTINYEQCKSAVDNNKVIVLFTSSTNVYDITVGNNQDIISTYNISGSHIMVIYGYYEAKYYNASGLFRSDKYLMVSTGLSSMPSAFYKPDSTTTQAAYIINIS